jgi:threonine aldolase
MRQVGILAAAGIYALERNVDRLAEDHRNACLLAERIALAKGIGLDPARVETNIIVFTVADAPRFVAECRAAGVLLNAFGPHAVRAVTHLDVDRAACEEAAVIITRVARQETRP